MRPPRTRVDPRHLWGMSRLHPVSLVLALVALTAMVAGGCTIQAAPRASGPAWFGTHPGAAGGTDLGPLTDARGRRRSLALASAGVDSEGGPYAARNDARRGVTAGFRSATYHTAQTYSVDRGPLSGGHFGHRRGHGLRDGYTTRTVRRSYSEAVR